MDLNKTHEEWWNDLTEEEREREKATALMEDRWYAQVEEAQKAYYEAEYQRNRGNSDYNYPTVDGGHPPPAEPNWDEIPF